MTTDSDDKKHADTAKVQGRPPADAENGGTREELIRKQAARLEERLTAPAALLAARDPGIWHQRALSESLGQAARWIRAARRYLDGDYDGIYPGPHEPLYTTLQGFREHYAADSLRDALHHLVWAERYAGTRDEESARTADPYRQPPRDAGPQAPSAGGAPER